MLLCSPQCYIVLLCSPGCDVVLLCSPGCDPGRGGHAGAAEAPEEGEGAGGGEALSVWSAQQKGGGGAGEVQGGLDYSQSPCQLLSHEGHRD